MKRLMILSGLGISISANAQVILPTAFPEEWDMSYLQGKPALPDSNRKRLAEIFAAAPEANVSTFPDGVIMERCVLVKALGVPK